MKIEHVLFPSVFQDYESVCWKVIFNVFTGGGGEGALEI